MRNESWWQVDFGDRCWREKYHWQLLRHNDDVDDENLKMLVIGSSCWRATAILKIGQQHFWLLANILYVTYTKLVTLTSITLTIKSKCRNRHQHHYGDSNLGLTYCFVHGFSWIPFFIFPGVSFWRIRINRTCHSLIQSH